MKLKRVIGAGTIAATVPFAAQAALINGKLGIDGSIIEANFAPIDGGGSVNFLNDTGDANIATGSFKPFINDNFDAGPDTAFTLNDLVFDVEEVIYFNDDIEFEVTQYTMLDNNPGPWAGFSASGIIRLTGFEDTPGSFVLSVQQGLMLLAALGGIGLLSRRGRAAAGLNQHE